MSNESEPRRGPGRPSMRADHREPAREEPRLTRKHTDESDDYAIPEHLKAEGYDYNWKRVSTIGQPEDPWKMTKIYENHWQPVQASELRGFAPEGMTGSIERGGLMLMKRPSYLSEEARRDEIMRARRNSGQVREALRQGGENASLPVREATIRSDIAGQQIPD